MLCKVQNVVPTNLLFFAQNTFHPLFFDLTGQTV